jgi:DNA-binding response OmpR family regulator
LIIGLTGEDNESSNELFLSSGADIVFIKPLDICKLHMINDFIMINGTDRQEKKNHSNHSQQIGMVRRLKAF